MGTFPLASSRTIHVVVLMPLALSTNGAFTGGQDPQNYTVVQQSDIDTVANSFKQPAQQSAQTALNGLKHANEQFVNKAQCTNNVTSNANVGDKATSVTVSVTATCTGEVYDQAGAETIAANLLKGEADKDTGGNYALSGNVLSSITSVTANSTGNLAVLAKAQGVWVYQFDATAKTTLAKLIVGKAQNDATTLLSATSRGEQGGWDQHPEWGNDAANGL